MSQIAILRVIIPFDPAVPDDGYFHDVHILADDLDRAQAWVESQGLRTEITSWHYSGFNNFEEFKGYVERNSTPEGRRNRDA